MEAHDIQPSSTSQPTVRESMFKTAKELRREEKVYCNLPLHMNIKFMSHLIRCVSMKLVPDVNGLTASVPWHDIVVNCSDDLHRILMPDLNCNQGA